MSHRDIRMHLLLSRTESIFTQPLDTFLYYKKGNDTGCLLHPCAVDKYHSFQMLFRSLYEKPISLIEIAEDNNEFHLVLWHAGPKHTSTVRHTAHTERLG